MKFTALNTVKMALKKALLFTLTFLTLTSPFASANMDQSCGISNDEATKLQGLLRAQSQIISLLEPHTLSIDLARLMFVKRAIQEVDASMRENSLKGRAVVTFGTMRLVQSLIIKYRHSTVFFGWEAEPSFNSIYTEETSLPLKKLNQSYQEIVKVFGYDDSPYTTITANTFKEIKKILDQVLQMPLDPELKRGFTNLLPMIGKTIAIAELGDRPCAFAEASVASEAIRQLYSHFDLVASTESGFSLIMELQGANEFFAEYSQADQQISPGQCR